MEKLHPVDKRQSGDLPILRIGLTERPNHAMEPAARVLTASGDVIRVISARKATAAERKGYIQRWRR